MIPKWRNDVAVNRGQENNFFRDLNQTTRLLDEFTPKSDNLMLVQDEGERPRRATLGYQEVHSQQTSSVSRNFGRCLRYANSQDMCSAE